MNIAARQQAVNALDQNITCAPQLESETRFAVVMYGGISLAIYIHGVAQELYHMVRATARMKNDPTRYLKPQVTGVEKVYRELGEALKTKFVVDILSGTSAGGINAVFLAKALANAKEMDFVKQFWADEGDISGLLNDRASLNGMRGIFSLQKETMGLLNSQRFYYKLLEALKQMGSASDDFDSPYVEELDLNITFTDIRGLNLPLYITNTNAIVEPRYRNVFRFYYRSTLRQGDFPMEEIREPRNDFAKRMDPFLAFAARCTASIPPAFEAMQLKDIEPVLNSPAFKEYRVDVHTDDWKRFYPEYLNNGEDFASRSFGDGGYLDNKPFSYATDALLRRRADVPVDRRLIYIEPSPEHPEDKALITERPDMLQNLLAALVGLPRSETIREDLERIKERNEVIRKIKEMLSSAAYNIPPKPTPPSGGNRKALRRDSKRPWATSAGWSSLYLMDKDKRGNILAQYGQGYIAYHQLLIESVLKNLAAAAVRAIGWNEDSEEERELHRLFHAWVNERYSTTREKKKRSQNDILYRLDLSFRMRRMHFLQGILDVILRNLEGYLLPGELPIGDDKKLNELRDILKAGGASLSAGEKFAWDIDTISDLHWLLLDMKLKMNGIYYSMKARAQMLRKYSLVTEFDYDEKETAGTQSKKKQQAAGMSETLPGRELLKVQLKDYIFNLKLLKASFENKKELLGLIKELSVDEEMKARLAELTETSFASDGPRNDLLELAGILPMDEKIKTRLIQLVETLAGAELIQVIEDLSISLASHPGKDTQSGYLHDTMETAREKDERIGIRRPYQAPSAAQESRRKNELKKELEERLQKKCSDHKEEGNEEEIDKKMAAYLAVYRQVQNCLAFYYRNFDYYDMVTFPITYGTDAGETDEVEVIRVSPEEATLLINERRDNKKKLAGTALANFGAFFKKDWRENDILWGRLDAAEILINEISKKSGQANLHKGKPQDAIELILEDDYRPKLNTAVVKLLSQGERLLSRVSSDGGSVKTLRSLLSNAVPGNGELTGFFKKNYEIDPNFPTETLKNASRATTVTGNLLRDLFNKYPLVAGWSGSVKSLSLWLTGLLFMAQGGTISNAILGAFYVGSILLIIAAILIPGLWKEGVIGLIVFLLTFSAHVAAVRVRTVFVGSNKWYARFLLDFLLPSLWSLVVILFWILLAFLLYLGLVLLGLPLPKGEWGIAANVVIEMLSTWMKGLTGLFTTK